MINHSIAANGQPIFPAGIHDTCQHPPSAHSLSVKPFHPNPTRKTPLPIAVSSDSTKGASAYKFPAPELNLELEPLALNFPKRDPLSDAMVELDRRSFASAGPNVAVLDVTVSSAVKLDDAQNALIARKMQRLTGFGNLRMENVVDTSLIAGFVISYGAGDGHIIDLSVKGQLAMLAAKIESSDGRSIGNNGQSYGFSM